jgi:hypothetical protein
MTCGRLLASGSQRLEALVLLRQSSPSAGEILTLSNDRPKVFEGLTETDEFHQSA